MSDVILYLSSNHWDVGAKGFRSESELDELDVVSMA